MQHTGLLPVAAIDDAMLLSKCRRCSPAQLRLPADGGDIAQPRTRMQGISTVTEPKLGPAQAAGSLRLPRHGEAEPHRNPFLQLLRAYLDAFLPRPGAGPAAGGVHARGYEAILAVPCL